MHRSKILCLIFLTVTAAGCDLIGAPKATIRKKTPPTVASASASGSPSASARKASSAAAPPHAAASDEIGAPRNRYALPFAWENSDTEPLARTREFVKEVLRDNQDYMKHGPKFFESFANAQRPRGTVVTCSDSRVQSAAWNLTPENDDFTIRNIGNQLVTSAGSVEYGVELLGTAVLLVIGHTGCDAVKAAMGDRTTPSPSVRREIDTIVLPKELVGQTSNSNWTRAVIANINAQVEYGLSHFSHYVAEGRLTVIGAIYDLRNDLGKGAGRLSIVNVNGSIEPARLDAFVAAVTGTKNGSSGQDSNPSNVPDLDATPTAKQIGETIESLPGLQREKPAAGH